MAIEISESVFPHVFAVDLSSYRTSAIKRARLHASHYRLAVAKSNGLATIALLGEKVDPVYFGLHRGRDNRAG